MTLDYGPGMIEATDATYASGRVGVSLYAQAPMAFDKLELVEGAGHFVWFERPGSVRASFDRLVAETAPTIPS